jgi:Prephenate dehydratase
MTKISCLGPSGTWSEIAARCYDSKAEPILVKSFREAVSACEDNRTDLCVLPLENSVEGPVSYAMDLLLDSSLQIVAERILPIRHALLSASNLIRRVYSHPQAIAQCRSTLMRLYPDAEIVELNSTSEGAKLALSEHGSAVIGSPSMSRIYGLSIVRDNVCDYEQNLTRFVVLGKDPHLKLAANKTTISFLLKSDGPGALVQALSIFSRKGINLSMVFSRPEKKNPGIYRFFIDAQRELEDPDMSASILELTALSAEVTVKGTYPGSSWKNPDLCK